MSLKILLLGVLVASVLSLEGVADLNDENFEATLADGSIWLVLFAAEWVLHARRSVDTVSP